MDFSRDYWTDVFEPFLNGLDQGRTPNPDVDCNRVIKFGRFWRKFIADEKHKLSFDADHMHVKSHADMMATGHYARIVDGKLVRAIDPVKDQSFYLAGICPTALPSTLLPIGDYHKTNVRQIAADTGLGFLLDKKESAGLCFVGKQRSFGDFISEYLSPKPGFIVDISNVNDDTAKLMGTATDANHPAVLGRHRGLHTLTIGQHCPVPGQQHRYFVAMKNSQTGNIGVVGNHQHPLLFSRKLAVRNLNWLTPHDPQATVRHVKIRARSAAEPCQIIKYDGKVLTVEFAQPVYAATPGQAVAFYRDHWCLGSGIIDRWTDHPQRIIIS